MRADAAATPPQAMPDGPRESQTGWRAGNGRKTMKAYAAWSRCAPSKAGTGDCNREIESLVTELLG